MFGENGFSHDGAHSARPNDPQKCGDQMDHQDNQMPHAKMLAAQKQL